MLPKSALVKKPGVMFVNKPIQERFYRHIKLNLFMDKTSRLLTLFLTLIIVMSSVTLLTIKPANAQTMPKPPEQFTLKFVDNSYDVPSTTTSTTDPYTGKTITTTIPGYHVEDKSIQITITNQPFIPYSDAEGHLISLYYNVRFKGHFGENWETPFYKTIRNGEYGFTKQHPQSDSQFTVISVPSKFQAADVVDFQVQTMQGYHTPWEPILVAVMGTSQFSGKVSDWSSTQTITIPGNSVAGGPLATFGPNPTVQTTPAPTLTTTQNPSSNLSDSTILILGVFLVIILALVLPVAALLVLLFRINKRK